MNTPPFSVLYDCLPKEEHADIARLKALCSPQTVPTVVVLGKYNHGKSSLLNALIGADHFKVSDIRETVQVNSIEHGGLRYMDTPGLDADVAGEDDLLAMNAVGTDADIRLFVHTAKAGELDAAELQLLRSLRDERDCTGRPVLLVLTQLDQVEEDALAHTFAAISRQVPDVTLLPVSSSRYRQGIADGKAALAAQSGFGDLLAALQRSVENVPKSREAERRVLIARFLTSVKDRAATIQAELQRARADRSEARKSFQADLEKLRARLHTKLK